jgi:hypothetical protein
MVKPLGETSTNSKTMQLFFKPFLRKEIHLLEREKKIII